jgi:chondroitin 4-sulfotransferase 11
MPLCLKHNLFFIHIPKTAGTSIEIALDMRKPECFYSENRFNKILKINPQHFIYSDLSNILNVKNLNIFTVVRNPFDRLVSEFKYVQKTENSNWTDYKNLNFDSFVDEVLNLDSNMACDIFDNHLMPQYDYIKGGEDIIKIFKYENLSEFVDWLFLKTNDLMILSHERNSEKMHYSFYYKYKKTIDMVAEFYKKDLEYFNYSFEMTE